MKEAYIAVLIASQQEMPAFARDLMKCLKTIAGSEITLSDHGHGTTVCAFMTDIPPEGIRRATESLWRGEQRIWVFRASDVVQGRGATLEWIRKRAAANR